jgi:hypothetical protein
VVRAFSGPRHGIVLVAVTLVHAGVVLVVAIALSSRNHPAPPEPVSILILLQPPALSPVARGTDAGRPFPAPKSTAITLPLPTAPVTEPLDWDAEAQRAAAAASGPPRPRAFGHNPATDAAPPAASPASAVHHAGEQYRDRDGTSIVFVSDHCFVASSPPPPGTADILARAMPTRTVCRGDPGWSRADLFKDLPAYRRYHAEAGAKP